MTKNNPPVSVIIVDYKQINPYRDEAIKALKEQTYPNFEVIIVTDYKLKSPPKFPRLKLKSYGHYVGPAKKRDDGAKIAKGEILVFLDDDAYPYVLWLARLIRHFKRSSIAAVGGPGINPPNISWLEAASGWFSSSPLGLGPYSYRFIAQPIRFVDDFPSMNLAIRKSDFNAVGGFDSHFYPGEDTKICLDLVYKLKKKILYDPEVLVFHHRRPLLFPHLKQNGNYGLHRGYFARTLPKTSFRFPYLLPSLILFSFIYLFLALPFPLIRFPYFFTLVLGSVSLYLSVLLLNSLWVTYHSKNPFQGIISIPVTLLTHFWYGLRFLQGFLFTTQLKR